MGTANSVHNVWVQHESTRDHLIVETPFFLVHEREALLPINVALGVDPNDDGVWDGIWGAKEELDRAEDMVENGMKQM